MTCRNIKINNKNKFFHCPIFNFLSTEFFLPKWVQLYFPGSLCDPSLIQLKDPKSAVNSQVESANILYILILKGGCHTLVTLRQCF